MQAWLSGFHGLGHTGASARGRGVVCLRAGSFRQLLVLFFLLIRVFYHISCLQSVGS